MSRSLQEIQNDLQTIEAELDAMQGYEDKYPEHFANLQQEYFSLSQEYQDALDRGMSVPPEDKTLMCLNPADEEALPDSPDDPACVSGEGDKICLPGTDEEKSDDKDKKDEASDGGGDGGGGSGKDRIPASGLSPHASGAFKSRVYNRHVDNAKAGGRPYHPALDASNVATVESGQSLRADAAAEMKKLLGAVRSARTAAADAGDDDAVKTTTIAAVSGYRSATTQFTIWDNNFADYYDQTAVARGKLDGGEHGAAAAAYLAKYIGGRVAAPGYSLHQSGIAMDLSTTYRGTNYGPKSVQATPWRNTWLFKWLSTNAATYGFHQNTSINEPWHWEFR